MMNTETTCPLFLIEFAKGVFAGNPTALRVTEQVKASLWSDEEAALRMAKELGGQVVAWTPPQGLAATLRILARRPKGESQRRPALTLVPTVAPAVVRRRGGAKAEPAPTPAPAPVPKPTKASKGPTRDEVMALVQASGLPLVEKSSTHAGDPKGARLVVPRSTTVTRLFAYKLTDASSPGFKTPEERKAEGLGAVTNVADVSDMEAVRALLDAVCVANGLKAPKAAPVKAKRSRKPTPAGGTPAVTPTGPQVTSSEAGEGKVDGATPEASGHAEGTEEAPDAEGSK